MIPLVKKDRLVVVALLDQQFPLGKVWNYDFKQLHFLQSLFEDKVLTENKYKEQKENILVSLRKLS